jgi:hypothetical protein
VKTAIAISGVGTEMIRLISVSPKISQAKALVRFRAIGCGLLPRFCGRCRFSLAQALRHRRSRNRLCSRNSGQPLRSGDARAPKD